MKDVDEELSFRKEIKKLADMKRVPKEDVDEELSFRKEEILKKKEEILGKPKTTYREKEALKKTEEFFLACEDEAPVKHYHNKDAKLVVKVIKNISCTTTSPPIADLDKAGCKEGDEITKGATVLKSVSVRRNAVGTVVDKVDGERIRVRFPRKVPGDESDAGY